VSPRCDTWATKIHRAASNAWAIKITSLVQYVGVQGTHRAACNTRAIKIHRRVQYRNPKKGAPGDSGHLEACPLTHRVTRWLKLGVGEKEEERRISQVLAHPTARGTSLFGTLRRLRSSSMRSVTIAILIPALVAGQPVRHLFVQVTSSCDHKQSTCNPKAAGGVYPTKAACDAACQPSYNCQNTGKCDQCVAAPAGNPGTYPTLTRRAGGSTPPLLVRKRVYCPNLHHLRRIPCQRLHHPSPHHLCHAPARHTAVAMAPRQTASTARYRDVPRLDRIVVRSYTIHPHTIHYSPFAIRYTIHTTHYKLYTMANGIDKPYSIHHTCTYSHTLIHTHMHLSHRLQVSGNPPRTWCLGAYSCSAKTSCWIQGAV
jgi:hypothetical protein